MKPHSPFLRRSALAIALTAAFPGVLYAQSTDGGIVGMAPMAAGETVLIEGSNGISREVPVDSRGRYSAMSLPLATYRVTLRQDGKTLDRREGVTLRVGLATDVSFSANASSNDATTLSTVQVTAASTPLIDVSTAATSTVITSEEMARLPLQRSAEAVALLAPGASPGSSYFKGQNGNSLVSFSGSAVTENAYYVNGLNTTDPLSGFGGVTLPYGAIDQQEVLSGGYSARYGRSDGGVISQVGKRGTNTWHFGGQALWEPAFAKSSAKDIYHVNGDQAGQIYQRNHENSAWTTTVDAYAGGPLIKDKLFVFTAVESQREQGSNLSNNSSTQTRTDYTYRDPKAYLKLDWNINDANILELTGLSQTHRYDADNYDYDYLADVVGDYSGKAEAAKTKARLYVGKYTSYITDDLTLTAMYGQSRLAYNSKPPSSGVTGPSIRGADQQNPAYVGNSPITNGQTIDVVDDPDHRSTSSNLRLELNYMIGDHSITAGIDNQDSHDLNDGASIAGPELGGTGYELWYAKGDPTKNISDSPFVDATGNYPGGQTGYYGYYRHYSNAASVTVRQRAQFIEDNWQATDNLLLQLGLRNDQFTNYNPEGAPYLRLTKPQWAPRLGATWDVNGDSTLKIYGNAGRYYLAMPASVALRTASGSLATNQYFTYTGIDANGEPTGVTYIDSATGGAVSPNGEYGQAPDPKTVSAKNIKSEYQDEFILGFDQQLSDALVWGMKGTVRRLRNALDDVCDNGAIADAAQAQGIELDNVTIGSCYLSNPGRANVYQLATADGGYADVTVTNADFGFTHLKRNYYGLNAYLSHPFDGKWSGRVDYLYSRSYGNTEGQVRSDVGQGSVSASRDWDYATLMEYANGLLPNDRTHVLKAYGSYQLAPEWLLSADIVIQSGTPKSCLGKYGNDESDPSGYGSYYHYCGGEPTRPGDKGRNPWQELVNLSAEYRPEWASKRLGFSVMVYNVLNQQRVAQRNPVYGTNAVVDSGYEMAQFYTAPRYLRFGMTYDF